MNIALAEDNKHLTHILTENISDFEGVNLLFSASNGLEVIQKLGEFKPDIILMDINMPLCNGIEATRKVKLIRPEVKIIMLTVFDDNDHIFEAILAGANGYLLKDTKPGRLLAALEDAMEGGAPMSPAIAAKALNLIRGKNETGNQAGANNYNLSKREIEILELLATGSTYPTIADRLFISPKTVRKHIENIYTKLQVHNKMEAVSLARDKALI